jgi:hypothetical protein
LLDIKETPMKKLLICLLLLPSLAWGQEYARMNPYILGGGVSAACTPTTGSCTNATTGECGTTYLMCEDFDGAVDCDSGAGESLYCRRSYDTCDGRGTYNSTNIDIGGTYSYYNGAWSCENLTSGGAWTAISPLYVFFKIKVGRVLDDRLNYISKLYTADTNTPLISVLTKADGTGFYLGVLQNTVGSEHGALLSYDTVYNVWWEYTKGTGTNAVQTLYVSTDGTKGSAYITKTDFTFENGATEFGIGSGGMFNGVTMRLDHIRVSSTQMTGVPD